MDLIEIAENARLMMHNRGTLERAQDRLLLPPFLLSTIRLFIATRGKRDVFAVHHDDDDEEGEKMGGVSNFLSRLSMQCHSQMPAIGSCDPEMVIIRILETGFPNSSHSSFP